MMNHRPNHAHIAYKNRRTAQSAMYSNQYVKQLLIDQLYDKIKINQYKFKLLRNKQDANEIKTNDYIITPNYQGYNYLMVFMKNKGNYYSYLVDRKTLSFTKDNNVLENIKMFQCNIHLDAKIYDGTIFDGIYYFEGREKYFIVNDVYLFRGEDRLHDKIKNKLIEVEEYIKVLKEITDGFKDNDIKILVNKYYEFNQIREAYEDYTKNKHEIMIRGLVFYPKMSGTKLIYMFENDKELEGSKQRAIKEEDIIEDEHYEEYRLKDDIEEEVKLTFEMRKTDIYELYKLYLIIPKIKEDGKKKGEPIEISYALIMNKDIGKEIENLFKVSKESKIADIKKTTEKKDEIKKILIDCTYDRNKKGWIPELKKSDKVRPDLLERYLEYFEK